MAPGVTLYPIHGGVRRHAAAALGPEHLEQAVERLRQRDYPAALAAAERAEGADSNSVAVRRVLGYLMLRAPGRPIVP